MKKSVIIVAGGSGTRMGSAVPKQLMLLNGKPILLHTIERFYTYNSDIQIIVVLPEGLVDEWQRIVKNHTITIPHSFVKGGPTRYHSVQNGLSLVDGDGLVAVHDGVRPLVSVETIRNCFETAAKSGTAIPVMAIVESIRKLETNGESRAEDRAQYCSVQTPQVFNLGLLKEAYARSESSHFTDDASVVESAGHKLTLVKGNVENIKITTPFDLVIAQTFLRYVEEV
jgi:2-C-methyl-D-erythritol 4-phosphate cytidylyltransferase